MQPLRQRPQTCGPREGSMRPTNNLQAKKDKKSMKNVKKQTKIWIMKKYFQKRQKIYEECQKKKKILNNEKIFPKETILNAQYFR
jgi:hypothetical protein